MEEALGEATSPRQCAIMLASVVFFGVLFAVANLGVSSTYATLERKNVRLAALHIVTGTFSAIVGPAAIFLLLFPDESVREDPIYGFSPSVQMAFGMTAGFFCLELFIIALFYKDLYDFASVFHGVTVLALYTCAQYPFLPHMGCICLLFELSTPFLKTFRFLEIVKPTSTGLISLMRSCFAGAFVAARILIGIPASVFWWGDLLKLLGTPQVHNRAVVYFFLVSNLGLNVLNLMWFWMILKGIFKKKSQGADPRVLLQSEQ